MSLDYNEIANKYDDVRSESKGILDIFMKELVITSEARILEVCSFGETLIWLHKRGSICQ